MYCRGGALAHKTHASHELTLTECLVTGVLHFALPFKHFMKFKESLVKDRARHAATQQDSLPQLACFLCFDFDDKRFGKRGISYSDSNNGDRHIDAVRSVVQHPTLTFIFGVLLAFFETVIIFYDLFQANQSE